MLQESSTGLITSGDSLQAQEHIPAQLDALQSQMMADTDRHVFLDAHHTFIGGIYARQLFIPAGVLIAGRIHKGEHISVISQGVIEVVTENVMTGETESEIYESPCQFTSPAGTKRMVLAREDTVWTTFHKHDGQQDAAGIEDIYTWADRASYEQEMLGAGHPTLITEV